MNLKKQRRYGINIIVLLLALAYVAKFGTPAFLKSYIEIGIGDCKKSLFYALCRIRK